MLSRSTRRGFVRRRPLPRTNFSEIRVSNTVFAATDTSFSKFREFTTATPNQKINTSTRRCFRSLSKPLSQDAGDFGSTENDQREILDELNMDHNPDEDFNSQNFEDETTNGDQRENDRIWMDPESPLEQRVDRFINQPLGSIHHLDIKLTSLDLIKECGKLKSFEGMKNAQEILDRLIEEKKYVNNSEETTAFVVIPDRPFQMVMYGWSNMCRKVKVAPQRMREVLDLMIQETEYDKKIRENVHLSRIEEQSSTDDSDDHDVDDSDHSNTQQYLFEGISCEPTVDIYNTLLQGLSQAATRSIQAAIEAEHALSKMDKMNRAREWHTKPNTRSFSLVLNAYSNSKHATAGERAELVLRDMIERHEYEKLDYFEEYGVEYNVVDEELNERKIVTPDTVAYTMVIQAHGSSDLSESADKALMLLKELILSENPALKPDSFCFANTINAFSKMASQKKNSSHRVEAAERAEDILWMMVDEMKKDNQNSDCLLSGSIVPFNACLNAWAQSFTPESPHRAEELLHKLLDPDLQSVTKVQPNTVSFNTCMQAWSKACKFEGSAAPEKAEEILTLLVNLSAEEEMSSDKHWKLNPDIRSYVTVMNAYALAQKEDSVIQTRRLLKDLIQEGRGRYFDTNAKDKMNAYPFTIVLKAAANAKTKNGSSEEAEDFAFGSDDEGLLVEDPYTIALDTYSDILNDTYKLGVSPDHFVFSEILAVIAKYTSSESIERRQRVEEVFHDACNAGQVSSLVVRAMQKACPNDIVLADLLRLRGNSTVVSIESINIFPRQWTSRVPQEFRRVSSRNDHFRKQSKFYRSKNAKNDGNYGKKHAGNKPKSKRRTSKN